MDKEQIKHLKNNNKLFKKYTKYLLEDLFYREDHVWGNYDNVLLFFKKNWKKDCTNGLDAEFCASLNAYRLEQLIIYLINSLEYDEPKINKGLIEYIMNVFILNKSITNDQIEYMLQNNHLWTTSVVQLRNSHRFSDLPEHLKQIISNKIKEMDND